jgi:O-methyltransferase
MARLIKSMLYQGMPESQQLRYLTYLPSLRKWREMHSGSYPVYSDRETLYEYINNEALGNREIDYLEFGVYKGESLMKWVELNSKPGSRFHGFDTFTWLPEDWHKFSKTVKERAFDVGGYSESG